MPSPSRRAALLVVLGALACTPSVPPDPDAGLDAGADATDAGSACTTNEIELVLTISEDGVADSQVVPVRYQGVDAWLAIDTGAPLTFVFGEPGDPEYVEHVGDVEIGCERYPVDLLTLEAIGSEPFQDRDIIGILGVDFFEAHPSELDYPGRRVVRYLEDEPPRAGLTEVPVDWNGDRIVVDAALDGEAVRLMYDAGSPHTLWVGQDGLPGDTATDLGTADGATVTVYEGTVALDFAGEVGAVVPVWRAPTFPYLEGELREIGADGLLGATGFGFRRVLFDLESSRLYLGPRATP